MLPPKIIEYKTLCDRTTATLDEEVNRHIKLGWCPYFGQSNDGDYIIQAMVKFVEPSPESDFTLMG